MSGLIKAKDGEEQSQASCHTAARRTLTYLKSLLLIIRKAQLCFYELTFLLFVGLVSCFSTYLIILTEQN